MKRAFFEIELDILQNFDNRYASFTEQISFNDKKNELQLILNHSRSNIKYKDLINELLKSKEGKKQLAFAISNINESQ